MVRSKTTPNRGVGRIAPVKINKKNYYHQQNSLQKTNKIRQNIAVILTRVKRKKERKEKKKKENEIKRHLHYILRTFSYPLLHLTLIKK
jgi:ABC-type lipopolysaccharide export system ATPase subunit